jgi:hypothetical protein
MDIRKIPKPFKKLKEVNDKVNIFIEVTSLDFGWIVGWKVSTAIGRRFKLTADKAYPIFRVFERIGYWSMKLLLNFAVTAPISIPLSLLISYFYADLLAEYFLASNRYMTHLLRLLVEVIA